MAVQKCIIQIDKVKDVSRGYEVAYVARSRIKRLILSLNQLIAKYCGLKNVDALFDMNLPRNCPEESRNLAEISKRLSDVSSTICQPSEPLDERWKSGWKELLVVLDDLEISLNTIQNSG